MNVYILIQATYYDYAIIRGVYSTKQAAENERHRILATESLEPPENWPEHRIIVIEQHKLLEQYNEA